MTPAQYIYARRKALNLSDSEVARRAGVTIFEYGDIEQHADELTSAISLGRARAICEALQTDIPSALGLPTAVSDSNIPRHKLIARQRQDMRLTVREVGDAIGFSDNVVHSLEAVPQFLDTLPVQVALDLGKCLNIAFSDLTRNEL